MHARGTGIETRILHFAWDEALAIDRAIAAREARFAIPPVLAQYHKLALACKIIFEDDDDGTLHDEYEYWGSDVTVVLLQYTAYNYMLTNQFVLWPRASPCVRRSQ